MEYFTLVNAPAVAPKYWTRLKILGRDKHSSLFFKFASDGGKKSFISLTAGSYTVTFNGRGLLSVVIS